MENFQQSLMAPVVNSHTTLWTVIETVQSVEHFV